MGADKGHWPVSLVWIHNDLRLRDQPALAAAFERGGAVIIVFIWSPEEEKPWSPGAASRRWLHQSLTALRKDLARRGARLVIRRGPSTIVLRQLIKETGATAVFWNHRYEPRLIARDAKIARALEQQGITCLRFHGNLLFDPGLIRTGSGKPYQVFTPFWRACQQIPAPLPHPSFRGRWPAPARWPKSLAPADLQLVPPLEWAKGFHPLWAPGEAGARARLTRFLKRGVDDYPRGRDFPAEDGTSGLSPHLHFGEISPREAWHAVRNSTAFQRELAWRDFAAHLLAHFPETIDHPLRKTFESLRWEKNPTALAAWQRGRTGYPWVDAGMRELWATGRMHNRVRMAAASFLVKDLGISWLEGARWFWNTLVDADLANNTFNWQWAAGCGADAAPYFRVFNPSLQGERFDPEGRYVRRWVPELKRLPARWIHRPWDAPADVLRKSDVVLGRTYPKPIVDHEAARDRALLRFRSLH